jgi:tripartite-type tricarboxylate transporter receptor subunit TctC
MNLMQKLPRLLILAGTCLATAATAQSNYPVKPVRLVVPFAPGGSAELMARVVTQKTSEHLGQPMVLETRPGANSNIGADLVAKAPADGYTVLYNTSSAIFNMSIYPDLSYDTLRDFAPVILTATVPQILLVIPSMPVKNLKEFIAHVRANPGKLNYASVGVGNIAHLTTMLFSNINKIEAVHVPYNGSQAAYVDLLGGRTQFYIATVASSVPYVKDNRLRPIAVTSLTRTKALPDVPTMNESGMPKFEATAWQGMLVPVKTPAGPINRLNADVLKALKDPDLVRQFDAQGGIVLGSTPQEYGAYLRSEHERWSRIIKEANIKPE